MNAPGVSDFLLESDEEYEEEEAGGNDQEPLYGSHLRSVVLPTIAPSSKQLRSQRKESSLNRRRSRRRSHVLSDIQQEMSSPGFFSAGGTSSGEMQATIRYQVGLYGIVSWLILCLFLSLVLANSIILHDRTKTLYLFSEFHPPFILRFVWFSLMKTPRITTPSATLRKVDIGLPGIHGRIRGSLSPLTCAENNRVRDIIGYLDASAAESPSKKKLNKFDIESAGEITSNTLKSTIQDIGEP